MPKTALHATHGAADLHDEPLLTDEGRITEMDFSLWKVADRLTRAVRRQGADESGASLVEYALLIALIAVVCIVAVSLIGGNASTKFSSVGSVLQ